MISTLRVKHNHDLRRTGGDPVCEKGQQFAQGCRASEDEDWDPGCLAPEPIWLTPTPYCLNSLL